MRAREDSGSSRFDLLDSISAVMPTTISEFLSQLRFPYLFLLTAAVFFLDVLVPDLVPFADEILLGLGTLLLSRLKKNRGDGAG